MSEKHLGSNSSGGGGYQLTLAAATSAVLHADKAVVSCMVWTALTDVYIQIDATATSSATSCLLPTGWTTLPYENMNQINLVSATGGAVNVLYRTR